MSNRNIQAKTLKLKQQIRSMPQSLDAKCVGHLSKAQLREMAAAMTERAPVKWCAARKTSKVKTIGPDYAPARDVETGEIVAPKRYQRKSVQRQLSCFKPARWEGFEGFLVSRT